MLQESFDPIIDKATKENLLLLMTKAEVKGEYDYRGMYTALLTHQGRAVCAAVFRAFGAQLAEVPLVATKADARRQGHCRVLMAQFESILKEVSHCPGYAIMEPVKALRAAVFCSSTFQRQACSRQPRLNSIYVVCLLACCIATYMQCKAYILSECCIRADLQCMLPVVGLFHSRRWNSWST